MHQPMLLLSETRLPKIEALETRVQIEKLKSCYCETKESKEGSEANWFNGRIFISHWWILHGWTCMTWVSEVILNNSFRVKYRNFDHETWESKEGTNLAFNGICSFWQLKKA